MCDLVQVLAKDGITVRGISRKGNPRADSTFTDYLSADPTNPNEEVKSVSLILVVLELANEGGRCWSAFEQPV